MIEYGGEIKSLIDWVQQLGCWVQTVLGRLREEIGSRLVLFHDARTDETEFRAAVPLF